MPLDPRIAMMVEPPRPIDVTRGFRLAAEAERDRLTAEATRQEMEIKANELAAQATETRKRNAVQKAFSDAGGDIRKALPDVMSTDAKAGLELQGIISKLDNDELARAKSVMEVTASKAAERSQIMAAVTDQQSYIEAIRAIAASDPEAARDLPPVYNAQQVRFWVEKGKTLAQRAKEAHDAATLEVSKRNAAANELRAQRTGLPKERVPVPGVDVPLPPDVEAQRARLAEKTHRSVPGVDVPYSAEVEAQRKRLQPKASSVYLGQNPEPYVRSLEKGEITPAQVPAALRSQVLGEAQNRGIAIVTDAERKEIGQAKKITPVLSSISELSEKINTQQGVIAKISGGVERAKAMANLNDDVAEYESMVLGFTPLVARAVGHVGVLTEQDVVSVRALFPRPGDSKSLRDRKINRLKTILGGVQDITRSAITDPINKPKAEPGGPVTVEAGGKTYTFPNQAAADAFKREAQIK